MSAAAVGKAQTRRGSTAVAHRPVRAASASATRATTSSQAPGDGWRNNRIVGYHGLSSPSASQRMSAGVAIIVHTGLPIAPAMCAGAVHTEITRSIRSIAAHRSSRSAHSVPRSTGAIPGGNAAVAGDIGTSSLTVTGTLTVPSTATLGGTITAGATVRAPVTVQPPCGCGANDLVDIAPTEGQLAGVRPE